MTRADRPTWLPRSSGATSSPAATRGERVGRQIFKLIPQSPRCRLCAAPFAGFGAPLMRLLAKRPSDKNPNWCDSCFKFMTSHHGGAEIEVTMLFADVRGSTPLGETMPAAEFHTLMDRFYDTAATAVFDNDGIVDKFVGDEVVAMFFPLLSGERHAAARLASAAPAGEILLTVETSAAAGLDSDLERVPLELRGKQGAIEVIRLRVGPAVPTPATAV